MTRSRLADVGHYAKVAWGWKGMAARVVAYCTASVTSRAVAGEEIPQRLMRDFFDRALRDLKIKVIADNAGSVAHHTPCVIAVNHNSMLDIPCVGVLLDFDYKWVSKKEVFNVPFIGWHMYACGHIWVDRKRKDNYERLQREFHRVIQNGSSILMFPEGTRSEDGALRSFKSGAFLTAVRENVPVVPVALDGTERLMEKGSIEFPRAEKDRIVRVKAMDAISVPSEGTTEEKAAQMKDACRAAMVTALDELRGSPGAAERPTI